MCKQTNKTSMSFVLFEIMRVDQKKEDAQKAKEYVHSLISTALHSSLERANFVRDNNWRA